MKQQPQTSKQLPASNSADRHHQNQPARPACGSGPAGGTDGPAEQVLAKAKQPPLPLPGIERFFPPEAPLELDYRTITLTKSSSNLSEEAQKLLEKWEQERAVSRGACLKIFPNGEISGGYYRSGHRTIPKKAEKVISQTFTKQARKTIRRAAECASTEFKLFITLTFDPKQAQLNDQGQVDQIWAKKEFKRFLNTIKKKYDRRLEKIGTEQTELSYIWVAEIQEQKTKNIHFHILVDQPFIPVKWLVDVWGQAANSVNVKRLSNQEHAVRYMLKYMGKGHCPIEGKRYGMTQNLLAGMKPQEIRFEGEDKREAFRTVKRNFYWQIEKGGGKVTDFGLFIPAPRREKIWRDKQGKFHKTKAVSRDLGRLFLQALEKPMKKIDWEHEIDGATPDTFFDDVPF